MIPLRNRDKLPLQKEEWRARKAEELIQNESEWDFQRFICYMFEPDDASYLALFRIMWGLIMVSEIYGHMSNGYSKSIASFYENPIFAYKYWLLEWCTVPDFQTFKIFLIFMLILGLFITSGFCYRVSTLLFTFGFVYLNALEAALYLNHFYLVIVISFMMCILPCHSYFSIDAMIIPGVASKVVPKWCLWTIRAELWIVYTYAGLAKINIDWIRGEPLRHWLIKRLQLPIIGWLFQYEPVIYWFSWSGLIYDLMVGTLLLHPKTFYIGLIATLFFHLMNKFIFHIGIFPWLMIASTSFYCEPYWPRRLIHYCSQCLKKKPQVFQKPRISTWKTTTLRKLSKKEKLMLIICFCFLAQQVITPIRHYMYPGNVFWNEYGHRYSWRMKLRDKQCEAELYTFIPETQEWFEYPIDRIISPRQYQKFASHPDLTVQVVSKAKEMIHNDRNMTAEMFVYSACRMNYREVAMLTNPRIALTESDRWSWPYDWVIEMPALTEEQREQLPWRNVDWILHPWQSNLERLKEEQRENINKMNEMVSHWPKDFRSWVIETKFNGNIFKANQYYRQYVDVKQKIKRRQDSFQGLFIFP